MLASKPFHHIRVWVVAISGLLIASQCLKDLELFAAEVHGLASLRVGQTSPALRQVDALQQGIQRLTLCGTSNALSVDVVTNVRVCIVV